MTTGFAWAESRDLAGRSPDAISTLETLRKLPLPLGNDPRIDLRVAAAASDADHAKALAADEQAIKEGTALGAKQLVARARGNQCVNLLFRGELDAATDACRRAREAYASAGDWNGVGRSGVVEDPRHA